MTAWLSPPLGFRLLLPALSLFASPLGLADEPAVEQGSPALPPAVEIVFRNGARARGEILGGEGEKFRFRPYGGVPATLSRNLIASHRGLSPAEAALAEARALAEVDRPEEALSRLSAALKEDPSPEIEAELTGLVARLNHRQRIGRERQRSAYREKYESLLDRRLFREAFELARDQLKQSPQDEEFLSDTVMAEFRLHRAEGRRPSEFRSGYLERLRAVAPESPTLIGVSAETAVAGSLQARWETQREAFLAAALDRARALYEEFRLAEARDVLERALDLGPSPEQTGPIKELLAKVTAEYSTQEADRRDREQKYQQSLKDALPEADPNIRVLSDRHTKNLDRQRAKRLEQRASFRSRGPR